MGTAFLRQLQQEFKGYNGQKLAKDLMAGLTVAAVALPLALAFGVSAGATAACGLVTAIVAGLIISALTGGYYQISGPTGAMAAILGSLVNGNSYVNAQITDMKIDDYNQQVTTADGRIVTATDPEKKDLVFTITTKVSKGTPAPAIGTQEVRAGRTFIVKTNDFETTGNIDSVDIADN